MPRRNTAPGQRMADKGVVPCKDCKVRARSNTPRTRELGVCWVCYNAQHRYHLCPCTGCPQCEGE